MKSETTMTIYKNATDFDVCHFIFIFIQSFFFSSPFYYYCYFMIHFFSSIRIVIIWIKKHFVADTVQKDQRSTVQIHLTRSKLLQVEHCNPSLRNICIIIIIIILNWFKSNYRRFKSISIQCSVIMRI